MAGWSLLRRVSNRGRRLLLLVAAVSCLPVHAAPRPLVEGGRSAYRIVLPDEPAPAEATAAKELREHIKAISGCELPTTPASEWHSGPAVAVGFNARLPKGLQGSRFGALAEEEFVIEARGDVLLLAGGSPRGTLYAVYEFLRREGVRWYTPRYTHIPKRESIALPEAPIRYRPPFLVRSILVGNDPTPEWSARNGQNTFIVWSSPGDEYGGGFASGPDMHTFWRLIGADELATHPEWAAEVKGERLLPAGNTNWGLCLRSGVRQHLIDRTLQVAREHPEWRVFWLGQNDGSPPCECAQCKAFERAHGGRPSAELVDIANEVAESLERETPGRMLKLLAYAWGQDPPTGMKLRDNVIVEFCASADYDRPIATSARAADVRARAAGWRAMAKLVAVYLYSYPSENYWFPSPCFYSQADNIRWAHDAGITDVYMQVSGFGGSYGSEAIDLRSWVYAQLMWDPTLDTQELVHEFCNDYYGPAAPAVLKALELVHTDVFASDGTMRKHNGALAAPSYLDPERIRQCNRMLEAAWTRVEDPELRGRLEFFWIPFLWADTWLGFEGPGHYDAQREAWVIGLGGDERRQRYAARVKELMAAHGVNAVRDLVQVNPTQLGVDRMGVPWPARQLADDQATAVVVPGLGGAVMQWAGANGFEPLKPLWYFMLMRYPLDNAWRLELNGAQVTGFGLVSADGRSLEQRADAGQVAVRHWLTLDEGTLRGKWSAEAGADMPAALAWTLRLNMNADAFGDAPQVRVRLRDGTWRTRILGEGLGDFWWASDALDLTDASGEMAIASSTRPEGIAIRFDPSELGGVTYAYDSYDYVGGYGHMAELRFETPNKGLRPGDALELAVDLRVVGDARE